MAIRSLARPTPCYHTTVTSYDPGHRSVRRRRVQCPTTTAPSVQTKVSRSQSGGVPAWCHVGSPAMAAGPVIELWSSEGWPQSSAVDPSPAGSARVLSLVRRVPYLLYYPPQLLFSFVTPLSIHSFSFITPHRIHIQPNNTPPVPPDELPTPSFSPLRDSAEHVHARICAVNGEREEIHVERKRRIQGRGHAERSRWATLANVFAGG